MKEVILEAEARDISTKHTLKDMRIKGMIPAIFYGHGEKAMSLSVNARKFDDILRSGGGNVLVNIKLGADSKTAIVKQIQRDVISRKPIHIDFQAISMKEKIEVSVPIHIIGIAPGVKLSGGVMEHVVREVRVSCLPTDIPEAISVDVSKLEINHSIAIKDLPKMEGIDVLTEPNSIIVNIVAPTILEEAPAPGTEGAVAAEGGAEPEVIAKGKKPEEGAEGAAPAAGDKKADGGKAAAGKAPEKK
jgi:large subunit ribosomal protein L25